MSEIKIEYYEDEINKKKRWIKSQGKKMSIFEANHITEDMDRKYVRLFVKWLQEGEYIAQAKEPSKNPPYNDPDDDLEDCSYYCQLTQFLNAREEWLKEKLGKDYKVYSYVAPSNCKCLKSAEPQGCRCKKDEFHCENLGCKNEITAVYKGVSLRLKSDQFGFSVSGNKAGFLSHPYGALWELTKHENDEFIAKCIYETRTLGGGFLWPKEIWNRYNLDRGGSTSPNGGSYIEDRVDLTLLEIKHLFEWIELGQPEEDGKNVRCNDEIGCFFEKINEIKKDVLIKSVITKKHKEEKGVQEAIEWLQHFGSFENYVEFFCFQNFVCKGDKEEWMPLDIMESEFEWNEKEKKLIVTKKEKLTQPTKYKNRGEHSIFCPKRSIEELNQMLKNVASLTLARSYQMQAKIDDV